MRRVNQKRVIQYISENEMLKNAFTYFLEYNTGYDNPYHNVNHTLAMMDLLMDMADNDKNKLDIMLLAAIFHDMNHSAGRFSDDHNITNAIIAYQDFIDLYPAYYYDEVIGIIKATEFPYKEGKQLTLMQQMVRECDNLVCFYDDFLTQVLMGLRSEMHTADLNTLIINELKFFENSWNMLSLPFSRQMIDMYGDELKHYLAEFNKIIA